MSHDERLIPWFLILAAAWFAGAFLWPVVRLRLRGTRALVFRRDADPFQALMGLGFFVPFLGYLVWAAALAIRTFGPGLGAGAGWMAQAMARWPRPLWLGSAGLVLMAAATVAVLLAQARLGASLRIGIDDRPTALVTGGIYRISRNPIFAAMLAFLLGVALATPSPWTVALGLGTWFVVALQVRLEEAHLSRLHGAAYRAYCARVPRYLGLGVGPGSGGPDSGGPGSRGTRRGPRTGAVQEPPAARRQGRMSARG